MRTVFHQMRFWIKSWSKKDHSSYRRGIEFRSPAWEAGMLTTILPRNCVSISFAYHFSPSFQRYFQIKCWTKKSVFLSSAGNWTRSLALQAGILITILSRNDMFRFLCGPSFTKCGFEQNPEVKKIILLLGGELSFGLPRDRRACPPPYYRGTPLLYRLRTIFQQFSQVFSNKILNQKQCIHLLGGQLNPSLLRQRRGYSSLYYRGITCFDFFVDRLSPNAVFE